MEPLYTLIGVLLSSASTMLGVPSDAESEASVKAFTEAAEVRMETSESVASFPLPRTNEREQLLTFGLYVTPDPAQNPIDPPERFTGYHTALDFEMLPGEEDVDVPVSAICSGDVLHSGYVNGYGGTLVQSCVLDDQNVTILYGHLRIDSLLPVGTPLIQGQQLGVLAQANGYDSGNTRKHLHLGIHKGPEIEFLGYAQNELQLADFIDPSTVLMKPDQTGDIPF